MELSGGVELDSPFIKERGESFFLGVKSLEVCQV